MLNNQSRKKSCRKKVRDVKLLRNAVKATVVRVWTSDCHGWFKKSGYC